MAYCTVEQCKLYMGIDSGVDDNLIEDQLIPRAQAIIDTYVGYTFEASADTTRRFDARRDVDGDTLYFDTWCAAFTTITNNADASSTENIASTDYVTLPRNAGPYFGIRLLQSKSKTWTYTSDTEMGITVLGRWAWSTTAPNDIVHACVRLVAFLYRQKDTSSDLDRPLLTGDGVTVMPSQMPQDVRQVLNAYRQRVAFAPMLDD